MIEKLLGKSNGISLLEHSRNVSKVALRLANKLSPVISTSVKTSIVYGGLLHDIGKCTKRFQMKLAKRTNEELIDQKLSYRHNEVGWSFLSQHLNLSGELFDTILDVVYWHHGISNELSGYNDTDIDIPESDKLVMSDFVKEVLGDHLITEKSYNPRKSPRYYVDNQFENCGDINMMKTFIRSCIISADRLVSEAESNGKCIDELLFDVDREGSIDITKHPYYGNDRFRLQEEISSQIVETSVINAPAGFGKTMLGLINHFNSDKKLIWVSPRNIIAESLYDAILSEINQCEGHTISIELYIAGEVVKHNEHFKSEFTSDIIITNIDNFLSPSVDNRYASRLWTILSSDVIFDEYHELVSESALFACFINLMNVRHKLTSTKTILLSATPTNMYTIWDSLGKQTRILPRKGFHYPAQHSNGFKIRILDSFQLDKPNENNLVILNSIENSQIIMGALNGDMLVHSNFPPEYRTELYDNLFINYGKSAPLRFGRPNTIATHVIQASLDISYCHLYESVLSPESTSHRIGRCNRFGDYTNSTVNIINYVNRSETFIRDILYSNELSQKWFNYISKYDGKTITLDEYYQIYNEYYNGNDKILGKYFKDRYYQSLTELSRVYPIKFYSSRKSDILTAGGNKLRSSGNEVFVICKNYDSDTYINPISITIHRTFESDFNETGNVYKKLLNEMRLLVDDERFDYEPIFSNKRITLDGIRHFTKKSNTPYIRFDKVFHPIYGVIKTELLNALIEK